ncbi:hypothetical protein EYF80_047412 [Liparis tanakae]|uniref:Uncharacterized protein n=1 Tax=Liparis tanakae TaxID=230148 RepID=A0A4Z2FQ15_9TELE|nr:hypothetical protein EYF80_047412 [Liparis tanakae]
MSPNTQTLEKNNSGGFLWFLYVRNDLLECDPNVYRAGAVLLRLLLLLMEVMVKAVVENDLSADEAAAVEEAAVGWSESSTEDGTSVSGRSGPCRPSDGTKDGIQQRSEWPRALHSSVQLENRMNFHLSVTYDNSGTSPESYQEKVSVGLTGLRRPFDLKPRRETLFAKVSAERPSGKLYGGCS